jgi:hypothetical protein
MRLAHMNNIHAWEKKGKLDMQTLEGSEGKRLTRIGGARRATDFSRSFLYRLSPSTPGVYVFGKSKRFCIEELLAWARKQAEEKAG